MGKIIYMCNQEKTPKPKRKRRKKDLDKIHSKILKAREKLDNVGKNDSKCGQKRQRSTRICNRLLPKPAVGIYRNGAKGRDIRRADIGGNTFNKARLEADVLKLFNGNTPETKSKTKYTVHHETVNQSPNKKFMKNNLEWTPSTLERSPILTKKQCTNQKLCRIKKKDAENPLKNLDTNKTIKQNAKNEHTIQRENICKRRLFENDREHLENLITPQTQNCDNIDISRKDKTDKDIPLENSSNTSWAPLNRYKKLCNLITAENFGSDFLQNYQSDPVITTVKKLRHAYSNSFRQQILREKIKLGLLNADSTSLPVEYQSCTYSDNSQVSIVEFEVPKCSEDHKDINHLREGMCSKNDKIYINSIQNARLKKDGSTTHNNTTPDSLNHTSALYNVSSSERQENNGKHYMKESLSDHPPRNFYFKNERDCVSDSQKNFNLDVNGQIYIDIPNPTKLRYHDKIKDNNTLFHINSMLLPEEYSSKDQSYEKLPSRLGTIYEQITTSSKNCTSNDTSQQCADGKTINKCNVKNVKRIPTILRRCNNGRLTRINNISRYVQIKDGSAEDLYRKSEKDLLKRSSTSSNNIARESYKLPSPVYFQHRMPIIPLLTPNTSELFDWSKDSRIIAAEVKNPQESKLKEWNPRSGKLNAKNKLNCFNNLLHLHSFDSSLNTNTSTDKSVQQQDIDPSMKKHFIHSNNNQWTYHTQSGNPSDFSITPVKQSPKQIKSSSKLCQYTYDVNNSKQEFFNARDQNQNILFKDFKKRAISTLTLNCSHNIHTAKKNEVCQEIFDKTRMKCAKMQTSQNACQCNMRRTHFDSINRAERCNSSCLTHRVNEEAMQTITKPETICNIERCKSFIDNNVNLRNGIQNVQLLSLEQKCNPYTYSKVTDNQHRAVDTVILQDVAQPVKYLAVKKGIYIQRIPVYINNGNTGITENVPLNVVKLESNNQTEPFPQQITTQVIPLQTNLQFDEFATTKKSNSSLVRHSDSTSILLSPDLLYKTWFASNL